MARTSCSSSPTKVIATSVLLRDKAVTAVRRTAATSLSRRLTSSQSASLATGTVTVIERWLPGRRRLLCFQDSCTAASTAAAARAKRSWSVSAGS